MASCILPGVIARGAGGNPGHGAGRLVDAENQIGDVCPGWFLWRAVSLSLLGLTIGAHVADRYALFNRRVILGGGHRRTRLSPWCGDRALTSRSPDHSIFLRFLDWQIGAQGPSSSLSWRSRRRSQQEIPINDQPLEQAAP
jgi:hypothetical protein